MNDGLAECPINPFGGLAGPYCESWLDCEQSNKPNCMLAWLSKHDKPSIFWLVSLHPDKPNLVLAWLDSLINPTKGCIDSVCVFICLCVSLLFPSSLWKSCPDWGIVVYRD